MADQKKQQSPWLGKDYKEAADLPEEVIGQMFDADTDRLDRAIYNARFIATPVPPDAQWPTCWACGKKAPVRFRDAVDGILVCRKCLVVSLQQVAYERLIDIATGAATRMGYLPQDEVEEGAEGDDGDEPAEEQAIEQEPGQEPEQASGGAC